MESFLGRPLDGGPYPYVWLDGLTQKVREGGSHRDLRGGGRGSMPTGSVRFWARTYTSGTAFWLAFLRSLARGLSGVELVTSDAHQDEERHRRGVCWGQLAALPHPLHGQPADPSAQARPTWRGHPCMVRTIYQQLSPAEVHGQLDRVVEQLREPFAQVAELLADAAPDILACTAFPVAHWQKLWSNTRRNG